MTSIVQREEPKAPLYFSYTKIKTFNICPYQYYLKYIKKEKPTFIHQSTKQGIDIHNTIEKLLKNEISLEQAKTQFFINDYSFSVLQSILNYLNNKEFESEKEIEFRLINNINIVGKIDLVIYQPNKLTLIDFKSFKKQYSREQIKQYYGEQLYLYGLAFENKKVDYKIISLSNGTITTLPSPENGLKDKFIKNVYQIINSTDYKPTPNHFCKYCQYKHLCQPTT